MQIVRMQDLSKEERPVNDAGNAASQTSNGSLQFGTSTVPLEGARVVDCAWNADPLHLQAERSHGEAGKAVIRPTMRRCSWESILTSLSRRCTPPSSTLVFTAGSPQRRSAASSALSCPSPNSLPALPTSSGLGSGSFNSIILKGM
jgi:hypothetical protein